LLEEAYKGDLKIVISEISLIECSHLKDVCSGASRNEQHRLIDEWFDSPFLVRRSIVPAITRSAMKLAREHDLGAADAIVLATALKDRVPELHTGDGSGRKKGRKLLPLSEIVGGDPTLRICEPTPSQLILALRSK